MLNIKKIQIYINSTFFYLKNIHRQDFIQVMDMIDRRLNDKGKNWRHVFKVIVSLLKYKNL